MSESPGAESRRIIAESKLLKRQSGSLVQAVRREIAAVRIQLAEIRRDTAATAELTKVLLAGRRPTVPPA